MFGINGLNFLVSVSIFCVALLAWYRSKYRHWSSKKIKGPVPAFFFGNFLDTLKKKQTFGTYLRNLYDFYKDQPYVGFYIFHRPILLIRDVNLIDNILAKDFEYFTNHGIDYNEKSQPLINHLFNANGIEWKILRHRLTPAFTSNKMKNIFDTMIQSGKDMVNYLADIPTYEKSTTLQEVIIKYTTDIMATCVFGIEGLSFKSPKTKFREMCNKTFDISFINILKTIFIFIFPEIQKAPTFSMIDDDVKDYFTDVVDTVVKERAINDVEKNDLMQLLIHLKHNTSIHDNEDAKESRMYEAVDERLKQIDIPTQTFGFFVGGYETTAATLSYLFYEIAKNPQIQHRLVFEINATINRHGGRITYEALSEMTFMSQVIEETLRMYPPTPQLFRICTKDYTIPNTNTVIEKGTHVLISVLGVHKDPEIHTEPEIFNPDRFSDEKKSLMGEFSFLAFGGGPRKCIGSKFAMLQIHIALVFILREYEICGANSPRLKPREL